MKKSSDGAPGAQSLFLNNTEHSASLAKSLVRSGLISAYYNQGLGIKKTMPVSSVQALFKTSESVGKYKAVGHLQKSLFSCTF